MEEDVTRSKAQRLAVLLATATLMALPAAAHADDEREQQLEKRVEQLEKALREALPQRVSTIDDDSPGPAAARHSLLHAGARAIFMTGITVQGDELDLERCPHCNVHTPLLMCKTSFATSA